MRAALGDRLVVRSHEIGVPDRSGVIIAVEGADGAPPYHVRWDDDHESTFVPGSDVIVEHLPVTTDQD